MSLGQSLRAAEPFQFLVRTQQQGHFGFRSRFFRRGSSERQLIWGDFSFEPCLGLVPNGGQENVGVPSNSVHCVGGFDFDHFYGFFLKSFRGGVTHN